MEKQTSQKRISSISAVFPAYNDGGTIASMVAAAWIALNQVTEDFEIIVVNDGSSDYTSTMLEEVSTRYPELRVITHPYNQGYGAALRTGFSSATKDWVFYTDGDSQYNPLELVNLVDALREGVDVVNGYISPEAAEREYGVKVRFTGKEESLVRLPEEYVIEE